MLPAWDNEREKHAKEILYRCMEELQATKAALYLEGSDGVFELAASYGFGRRDGLAPSLPLGHPLMDWTRRNRTGPAYLNAPQEFPALGPLLESALTSRLMTIPLAVAGRMVGLVDARDKSRRAAYGTEDVAVARSIGHALERFVAELGGSPPLAEAPAPPPEPAQATMEVAALSHHRIIEDLTGLVRSLARLPELAAAVLTLTDGRSARALALHAVPLDQQHRDAIAAHQARAFLGSGVKAPAAERWGWDGQASGGSQTRAEEIRTAVLMTGPPVWVALSLVTPAGAAAPDAVFAAAAHGLELARSLRDYRRAARNLARVLLEPGETSFPHLRQHSQATSEVAQRMAAALHLPEDQDELVTVAAYLHDVGMRELDYARVYRLERPGEAEQRIYHRHPVVGARIVEASEFPGDLAGAIRYHHERWDGGGYPQHLAGRTIPLASRIIHLAEVYDVLTSPSSYRRALPREAALDAISAEAGRQFDPELVPALVEAVRP
ncbi:MAG TPA: HD domain-containing phosphohydrolase [Thermoanaerobaculaceae bacterium]|nr:HD domain-containing phosphohydrolase [Thermoanaerobaculaceae bacterium]